MPMKASKADEGSGGELGLKGSRPTGVASTCMEGARGGRTVQRGGGRGVRACMEGAKGGRTSAARG
jgi:hypothetical protein